MKLLRPLLCAAAVALTAALPAGASAAEPEVQMTWMSIANWYFKIGDTRIVLDGYISRVPGPPFFYAPKSLPNDPYAYTKSPYKVDVESVARVKTALLGGAKLNYLLSGHSHFDHSWDTPEWSKETGAPIIGGQATCFQAMALGVAKEQCRPVSGGEKIDLGNGITVRVVRFNHSGDNTNPVQHFARELYDPPTLVDGGLKAGVGEDYPNGGGGRAFLFTVDQGGKKLSFFVQTSASGWDFDKDIWVDGINYGSPLNNLKAAMADAGLTSVDVWIGTGGEPLAKWIVPVIHPKAYLPSHWDGLFNPFWPGMPYPFKDDALKAYLEAQKVPLLAQQQYFDGYRLTAAGIKPMPNSDLKKKLGFSEAQKFSQATLDAVSKVASTSMGDDCGEGQFEIPLPGMAMAATPLPPEWFGQRLRAASQSLR